ncbi:MAG: metallophosphoesterase family protein [Hyphococcus sp.]
MLGKLFSTKHEAEAPEGRRIYAIGDIHGCASLLDELLRRIETDAGGAPRRLVFLGDYVDRGPDAKGVLTRLIEISRSQTEAVFLKGNHEAVMLDFLAAPEDMDHWLDWGGEETLASYGVAPALGRRPEDLAAALKAAMPADHLAFLNSLALTHIEGDYLFVHAGLRPGAPLSEQTEEDLLWIRKRFNKTPPDQRPDKVVVHGHQPQKKPDDAGWRIAVDTGACWTGRLTAVALEGTSRQFIST